MVSALVLAYLLVEPSEVTIGKIVDVFSRTMRGTKTCLVGLRHAREGRGLISGRSRLVSINVAVADC